jgi:hypothetical protein
MSAPEQPDATTGTTGPGKHAARTNRIMAITLVLSAVTMLGLMIAAGMQIDGVLRDFQQRFRDQGYTELDGRTITLETPPQTPQLIYAEHVTLAHGSHASLAIFGGDAVLEGRFEGDVAFLGSNLDLAPGAVITGNLTLDVAKHVTLRGRIEGELIGGADRIYGDPTSDSPK